MMYYTRRDKTVSQYVSKPVAKPDTVRTSAVVTAVTTLLVASVNQQQRIVPATHPQQSQLLVKKIIVGSENVIERLVKRYVEVPRHTITLETNHCILISHKKPSGAKIKSKYGDTVPQIISIGHLCLSTDGYLVFTEYPPELVNGRRIIPVDSDLSRVGIITGDMTESEKMQIISRIIKPNWVPLNKHQLKLAVGIVEPNENERKPDLNSALASEYVMAVELYDEDLGYIVLRDWEEFLHEIVFKGVDKFIKEIYMPLIPSCMLIRGIRYAPSIIFGSPSGTGKSTLADALGWRFEDATTATILGGYFEGKVRGSVINRIDDPIFIESLESEEQREIARWLLGITSRGTARRAVGGQITQVEYRGAVVFTFNPPLTQSGYSSKLAQIASRLSTNGEALGGRLILLASRAVRPLSGQSPLLDPTVLSAVMEAIRVVRHLMRKKVQLGKDTWLTVKQEANKIEPPDSPIIHSEKLLEYFNGVERRYSDHLAKLALSRALTEFADRLVNKQATPTEVIRRARELLARYNYLYRKTANEIAELLDDALEYEIKITFSGESKKKKFVRCVLESLWEIVHNQKPGLGPWVQQTEGIVKIEELGRKMRKCYDRNMSNTTLVDRLRKSTDTLLKYIDIRVKKTEIYFDLKALTEIIHTAYN